MKNKKKLALCLGVVVSAAMGFMSTASYGDLSVYEGFDYEPNQVVTGLDGGTGFGGPWAYTDGNNMQGYVWPENPAHAELTWDGVVTNVPQSPAFGSRYMASDGVSSSDVQTYRPLATNAQAMAGADNILWMSAVYHYENRGYGAGMNLGLGNSKIRDRGRSIKDTGSDYMGISTWNGSTWNQSLNAVAITNYPGGNVVWGSIGTQSTIPPTSEDIIVVMKYTFGAIDTVDAYAFSEFDTLSESAFTNNAVRAALSLDESVLTTLSYSQGRMQNGIDEIRMGDTFLDVIGATAGPVDTNASVLLAMPTAVPADGATPSTIMVALRDSTGSPVTNHTVSVTGDTGNAMVTAVSATTDASGKATFEVTSSTPETEVFTATDTTASVVITETASIEFVAVDENAPPPPTFVTPLGPITYHSITVAVNPVTDPEGKDVEYQFNNVTLGTDSGWLPSPSHTFAGLTPETSYSFTVEARDTYLTPNVSDPSDAESATTISRPVLGWSLTDSTANTIVWLDASDTSTLTTNASGHVSQWNDKSGNGNHQLQANTSYQPVSGARSIFGLNALDFDGSNDRMQEASNAFGSVISNAFVFMIVSRDGVNARSESIIGLSSSEQWEFMTWGWDNPDAMFRLFSGGGASRIELRDYTRDLQNVPTLLGAYDSVTENVRQIWINAVNGKEGISGGQNTTSDGIRVGKVKENGTYFDGLFAEVVIIDGIVTKEERQEIEGYLVWKWGAELSLPADHPYYDLPPAAPPVGGTVLLVR